MHRPLPQNRFLPLHTLSFTNYKIQRAFCNLANSSAVAVAVAAAAAAHVNIERRFVISYVLHTKSGAETIYSAS